MIAEPSTPPAPVNRARRVSRFAAVAGAAALITGMLAGCGAGQISETSTQHATVGGTNADLGKIALRNMQIEAPKRGSWDQGATVALTMTIVNNTGTAEDLIGITTDAASKVLIFANSAQYLTYLASLVPTTAPAGPAPAASPSASASTTATSTAPAPTTSAPAPAPTSSTPAAVTPAGSVTVPSNTAVEFGYGNVNRPVILLVGLTAPIGGGSAATLSFTFSTAGTVSAAVPISLSVGGASDSPTLNLHHEGGMNDEK